MFLPESQDVQRLGIFFFYDRDGIVDDYIPTLVEGLNQHFSDLTIVVNGKITDEGRKKLEPFTSKFIIRPNKGYDAWAYKAAMESYGWDELQKFDEIVLFNSTIMGPVYPFAEMFTTMGQRDLDFWGITKFHKVPKDPFKRSPYPYLPEHIQSHFHAYRRSLVSSKAFQDYWDNLPPINSYYDSVGLHESLFTKRFADKGFKWDVYVNTDDLEGMCYGPIIAEAKTLVAEKRCPIFKRRSFFQDYADVMSQSVGYETRDLYEYLRDHTSYDTNLIWQNALRSMNLADLMKNLHLEYVLPQEHASTVEPKKKIALVMHLYYMDLLDQTLSYLSSMPNGCDMILTVCSDENANLVRDRVKDMPYNIDVRVIENRGRDVSALLVGAGKDLYQYDYVCFGHDKKVTQISPQSVGDGFRYKCFENILASKAYVTNVISLFDQNPRLGIAMPSPPNHANYFPNYTFTWGPNYLGTKKFLRKTLKLNVPLYPDKEAVAPLGTMFWFRPQALNGLLDRGWTYEDFPTEPNKIDGTLLHFIERSYCYVAQSNGYFPAYIYTDRFASIELTNLSFELRQLTRVISDPWMRKDLEETRAAVANGKRFRITLLRVIKNLIKRIPLVGSALVRMKAKREGRKDVPTKEEENAWKPGAIARAEHKEMQQHDDQA